MIYFIIGFIAIVALVVKLAPKHTLQNILNDHLFKNDKR